MISATTIAWVAGIVEGEGWIGTSKDNPRTPRIKVSMTDEDVIARVAVIWQRTYQSRRPQSQKPYYTVSLAGHHAAEWLMTLLPFLGKRRRAKAIQTLQAWRSGGRTMVGATAKCHPERKHAGHGLCDWCWVQRREEMAVAGTFTGNKAKCHPDRPHRGLGFCRQCYLSRYTRAWTKKRRAQGTLPLELSG